ncbi:MAG: hypothetical protein IR164_15520 [Devosia sp.]|jgi:hypothetical protein|uniref:hypothetical protein n=1 Tax=Devosia sp. TaxID=1871048 RepID=UPI001A054A05|nr:hypothetical protein [Devosia sp.]MBF0680335.1 hypothetical protein [Devosia sp.]
MSENVIKFRRPEKKPEPEQKKPRPPMPGWAPMAGLVVIAVLIYLGQQSGVFG